MKSGGTLRGPGRIAGTVISYFGDVDSGHRGCNKGLLLVLISNSIRGSAIWN